MTDNTQPDWVADRARCNLNVLFKEIEQIVKRDVQSAQKLPPEVTGPYEFFYESSNDCENDVFKIKKRHHEDTVGPEPREVVFRRNEDCIEIDKSSISPDTFKVTTEWDSETSVCSFIVEKKKRQPWQISRIALEELFFSQ